MNISSDTLYKIRFESLPEPRRGRVFLTYTFGNELSERHICITMETSTKASWVDLPTELRVMVTLQIADIPSLFNLVLADPSIESLLHSFLPSVLPSVLARSMPLELQNLVYMILAIQTIGKVPGHEISRLLQCHLDPNGARQIWRSQRSVIQSMSALRTIAYIHRAIEYFTQTFATCLCQSPSTSGQAPQHDESILSAAEIHRVRRALWRFEACCELSRSWLPSYDSNLVEPDDKISRLGLFLKQLNPWEIEELHCVYEHLENLLDRNSHDPRTDCSGKVISPYTLPTSQFYASAPCETSAGTRTKRLSQGLISLHDYLQHTPVRTRINDRHYVHIPNEDFIISTIRHLKHEHQRFSNFHEWKISSDTCQWTDNHGTSTANSGWRFFSYSDADKLHSFAYLRQFGFCIWDERRLRSWAVLNHRYGESLNKQLMAIWYPWASADQIHQIARSSREISQFWRVL